MKRTLIEIHTLRNLPTSHLNADDTGALKTCTFGGTERARVSSQCIKNGWRKSDVMNEYSKSLNKDEFAFRTRELKYLTFEKIKEITGCNDEDIEKDISYYMVSKMVGSEKGVVCFISSGDIDFISSLIIDKIKELTEDELKALKKAKEESKTKGDDKKLNKELEKIKKIEGIDKKFKEFEDEKKNAIPAIINLFGRMSTAEVISTIDSAVSVSHAFSTHETTQELDYFTAVDDIAALTGSGSGHLDETSFNSACYYHYMNFSVDQFKANMDKNISSDEYKKEAIEKISRALIETVCLTNPETKKTGFASATLPEAVYVVVKNRNIPCSYANAYADPVENDENMVKTSVKRLASEADMVSNAYDIGEVEKIWFSPRHKDICPENATVVTRFSELIEKVSEYVKC